MGKYYSDAHEHYRKLQKILKISGWDGAKYEAQKQLRIIPIDDKIGKNTIIHWSNGHEEYKQTSIWPFDKTLTGIELYSKLIKKANKTYLYWQPIK